MSELKATTAQEIVREEKDCDYMDELFGGVKIPPTQVYIKSEADAVMREVTEEDRRLAEKIIPTLPKGFTRMSESYEFSIWRKK